MEETDGAVDILTGFTPHLWAVAIVFFGMGDLVTRGVGLTLERAIEVGPVASLVYQQFGFTVLVPLKLATLGVIYLLWRVTPSPHNAGVPLGLATLGVLVTLWNLSILMALL